jgi:uncharacterized phage protein gp47/JayE
MSTNYGVTATGFEAKQIQTIISEINAALQTTFGPNINLGPESVLGQIVGIFAEREALLWQLNEAVYDSQYPNGAEGTSVDNILALNNLQRLAATPTVTNPLALVQTDLVSLYGLILFGTAGTIIPAGSIIQNTASPPLSFTLDNAVTIEAAVNAVQSIFFSNTPNMGAFSMTVTDPFGTQMTTPSIPYTALANETLLNISTTPTSGSHFALVLTQGGVALTTANISTPGAYPSAATIQSAITALSGYSGVTVSGSAGSYTITWGSITNPVTTITNNTTLATITTVDSVQSSMNNLNDVDNMNNPYPFSDVQVTGSYSAGFQVSFGAGTPLAGSLTSGNQPIPIMLENTNSLQNGSTVTNINIVNSTVGMAAQGIGTATCTVDGPNFVAANTLTVIGSPVSGWTSVTNQLDCISGTNTEDDTQALQRRNELLASAANGPLQAIVEKVKTVEGVTAAIGFQNLTDAALQVITWTSIPSTGNYQITINGQTTASLAYNASASAIQTAIQALSGYGNALVTGDYQFGFTIDFNGSYGGQAQPLSSISFNTTGVSASVAFGRPPHSFEIVVQGGDDATIAETIYGAMPAGILSYGSTTIQIEDAFNNPINISFSRPTEVTLYVTISMTTDIYNTPGNPGSGKNPNSVFNPGSVATIQQDLIAIANAVAIGGLIIGFGSNGLIGAFNSVPGIVSYTMNFGLSPSPGSNANIQLQSEQVALLEQFNVQVSYD